MRTNEPNKRCRPLKPGQARKYKGFFKDRANMTNISALPAEKKKQVWAHLRNNKPNTAALLSDDLTKDFRNKFGAQVFIDNKDLG